ncbi:MAG: DEAD/DEAH box helicase [Deltaproteobacteria bacterium]|nr:DEAD/DEAH box helicase [Deltaproteobacteria bacterium]
MSTESTAPSFESLGIPPNIVSVLKDIGYESPTPIQEQSIPILLSGASLLGQAQTGTGKTGAFALPLLTRVNTSSTAPQVLVLTPTRELAIQVAEAFQTYARKMKNFHVLPIYGGQGMGNQLHQLRRGAQVIVGTPGRIMDHLRRKTLDLGKLQSIVLDEADEMLNMGFIEDIDWILEHTPAQKQVALFSATMPDAIRKVARKHLKEAQEIKIQAKTATVEATSQYFWVVSGLHKLDALTRIFEGQEFDAALVFVRTKTATVELAEKLQARGYSCAALSGDLTQMHRERTVEQLKKGALDIIVATDVAARGLDVSRISMVVNYDIPYDAQTYVHRIGRTGRAGRTGTAILFVSPRERHLLNSIERATKQRIEEFRLPTKKDVTEKRIQKFKDGISEVIEKQDLGAFTKVIEEFAEQKSCSPTLIASALCFLAQKGTPFVLEELPAPKEEAPRRRHNNRERSGEGAGRGYRNQHSRPHRRSRSGRSHPHAR